MEEWGKVDFGCELLTDVDLGKRMRRILRKRKDCVEIVILSNNKITDEGIIELMQLLPLSVWHIDLSFNQISEEGAQLLLEFIEKREIISKLMLLGNPSIKDSTLKKITKITEKRRAISPPPSSSTSHLSLPSNKPFSSSSSPRFPASSPRLPLASSPRLPPASSPRLLPFSPSSPSFSSSPSSPHTTSPSKKEKRKRSLPASSSPSTPSPPPLQITRSPPSSSPSSPSSSSPSSSLSPLSSSPPYPSPGLSPTTPSIPFSSSASPSPSSPSPSPLSPLHLSQSAPRPRTSSVNSKRGGEGGEREGGRERKKRHSKKVVSPCFPSPLCSPVFSSPPTSSLSSPPSKSPTSSSRKKREKERERGEKEREKERERDKEKEKEKGKKEKIKQCTSPLIPPPPLSPTSPSSPPSSLSFSMDGPSPRTPPGKGKKRKGKGKEGREKRKEEGEEEGREVVFSLGSAQAPLSPKESLVLMLNCSTSLNPPLSPPSTLAVHTQHIEVGERLSTYGRADVYVCYVDGWMCAMKEITLEKAQHKALLKEISILMSLPPHPHVVRYLFWRRTAKSTRLFLTRYLCSLTEKIKDQKEGPDGPVYFSVQKIAQWVIGLVKGLMFLHENQIMHRDIKPSNIFAKLTSSHETSSLVLGDFDCAALLEADGVTRTMIGTPIYMAPEVLDSGGYTYSADIYSLGVVLHEMASLEQPYSRFPKNLVPIKIIEGEKPLPPDNLPEEFTRLLDLSLKMTEKEPKKRVTLKECFDELEKIAQGY